MVMVLTAAAALGGGCSFDGTAKPLPYSVDGGDTGATDVSDAMSGDAVGSDVLDASDAQVGDVVADAGDTADAADAASTPLCTVSCTSDDDCPGSRNVCVSLPDGNFCTHACGTASDCPDGYDCSAVTSVDGLPRRQCMPSSTVCAACFDQDGDGYGLGDGCVDADCDDTNADVHAGATEQCDGVDNNCDGTVDEGCTCADGDTQSCYSGPAGTEGVGQCHVGSQTCSSNAWGSCSGEKTPDADETCGDNIDNNCDGSVDEGCACDFSGTSTGVCADGVIDANGNCTAPAGYEATETSCDQLDNDCDGVVDEGCACDFGGTSTGVCATGSVDPSSGDCTQPAGYEADETSCDGVDNDCDGTVDEGCGCQYNGLAVGVCAAGVVGANGSCEAPATYQATETSCDSVDNDCDGTTDEGCACDFNGTSTGVCASGVIAANGTCQAPSAYQSNETSCDGVDNDCDGVVDEGCSCNYNGSADGVCASGTVDASTGNCAQPAGYESTETSCDGVDNDCDQVVDEGCNCIDGQTQSCYSSAAGTAGVGQCKAGSQTCSGGAWGNCVGEVVPTAETCDGVDNNCDGLIDEGCSCNYNSSAVGVCAAGTNDGSGTCQAPASYQANETLCDGLDNDCDGTTDEGCSCNYNGSAVGVCANGVADGSGGCQAPATYQATETSCDGRDNDCDGAVDEGCSCNYNGLAQGVCATATRDSSGACQMPAGYMADEAGASCDNLDNDCDGTTDENCCSGVDPNSAVTVTSGCLTDGTGAESAVVVDLVDANGNPVTGASVTMTTTAGTLSAVQSSGNTYWAVLTPPATSGVSAASVTVSAANSCSGQAVQMSTTATVALAAPFTDTAGGAGGCSVDGNMRVRVVRAEDGTPVSGAHVMIGNQQDTAAYADSYGASPSAANTATTDANGFVEFHDFGSALGAPVMVTAGATGRAYMTMVGIDASDLVLPLEQVDPNTPTRTYDGDFTSIDTGGNIDVGFMLSDVTIDTIMNFNLSTLLSDNVCYRSGNFFLGNTNLPGNVYIPSQSLGLLGSLNKKSYVSAPVEDGNHYLTGVSGETTNSDAASGDIFQILKNLNFQKVGTLNTDVNASATTSGVNIDMTNALTDNVSCDIANQPADSDVFCLMTGDWDSKNDATIPMGAGRLFLMGLRVDDSSQYSGPFTINNVSTVTATGEFTNIQYMGVSVATYLDQTPTPPAGTENGTTIVARRDPSLVDGNGGSLSFDDYIPIRPLTRTGDQFQAAALTGTSYPAADLTRTTIRQKITQSYSACGSNDSTRTVYHTLWTVYTDGATDAYTLPTLPSGWPRAADNGLIDPAATPENDVLNWMHVTLHEGLDSAFDYDALVFDHIGRDVTHASINNQDF